MQRQEEVIVDNDISNIECETAFDSSLSSSGAGRDDATDDPPLEAADVPDPIGKVHIQHSR